MTYSVRALFLSILSSVHALNHGRTRESLANIPTTISSPESLEFESGASLSCVFDFESVEIEGKSVTIDPATDKIEVSWSHKQKQFVRFYSESNFEPIEIYGMAPLSSSSFNFDTRTTEIVWDQTALEDGGAYGCNIIVTLADGKVITGAAGQKVDVYNIPEVNYSPLEFGTIEVDIRDNQLHGQPTTRDLGFCVIDRAYPKPVSVVVHFGDKVQYVPIPESSLLPDSLGLYKGQIVLDEVEIEGHREHQQVVSCSVSEFTSAKEESIWGDTKDLSSTTVMDVKYLPTWVNPQVYTGSGLLEPTPKYIVEDTRINITCEAHSNPPAVLTLSSAHVSDPTASSHTIEGLDRNEEYTFQCKATVNEAEFADWSKTSDLLDIKVAFMDEPKIVSSYGETDDVNILPVDQEATLSCEVNSAPPADTFEWIKDNVLVDSEVYQTYNIANAEWSDSGDYICKATTPYNSESSPVANVQVHGKCVIHNIVTHRAKDQNGEDTGALSLECVIDKEVQPDCRVEWDFNKNVYANANSSKAGLLEFVEFNPDNYDTELPPIKCVAKNTYHPDGVTKSIGHAQLSPFIPPSNATLIICCIILLIILIITIVVALIMIKKRKSSTENGNNTPNADDMTVETQPMNQPDVDVVTQPVGEISQVS